ncbi:hypothetical protein EMCRGX_G026892 [Ephydatia muelleri]
MESAHHLRYATSVQQSTATASLVVPHVSEEGPVQVPPRPSFFIHEPPPNDSGHPSSIDIESTDFEDNLETDVLSSSHHTAEPDFRPFSSRIDAMAYLIVHSPRSMGEGFTTSKVLHCQEHT